jgi:acetolactate synthase-1/2/3 large subunit
VVLAPKAKGVIPEDHPLVAGVIEMLGDGVVIELTRRADLLIAIGFDPVELDKPWLFDVPVIHIDSVPNYDGYYPSALEVVGDIASAVGAITGGLPVSGTGWTLSEIEASKKTLERLITRPGSGMAGHEVVRIAREELPADTIATCDVGAHKMLVGQLWKAYRPREFFMSNGLSSMGYGFPTALVAKMLHPDRPVIAFVGDGGMSMYLGELETAVRLGTNLIAVVMCDQSLSLIKMNQERKGIPYTGVEFANPDYGKVAECMGAAGFRAGTPQALLAALRSARSCNRPAVIHADIDGAPYRLQ